MPCYCPLDAFRAEGGGKLIFGSPKGKLEVGQLTLPCGQCVGCRLDRSVAWAIRVMHENQLHRESSFVTLTYDDRHLPYGGVLHYRHFQLFCKKLRERRGPFRFFMCGEYGDKEWRPHYHVIIFGLGFDDRYVWRVSDAGFTLYRSPELEKVWGLGNVEIGDVTFDSAAYVARYCMKKITGDRAEDHYAKCVWDTGEMISLEPEFARMSLKPGIGAGWIEKYKKEVLRYDGVVMNGSVLPVPKYYQDRFTEEEFSGYAQRRYAAVTDYDNSSSRLRVREIVTRARLAFKTRGIE